MESEILNQKIMKKVILITLSIKEKKKLKNWLIEALNRVIDNANINSENADSFQKKNILEDIVEIINILLAENKNASFSWRKTKGCLLCNG